MKISKVIRCLQAIQCMEGDKEMVVSVHESGSLVHFPTQLDLSSPVGKMDDGTLVIPAELYDNCILTRVHSTPDESENTSTIIHSSKTLF